MAKFQEPGHYTAKDRKKIKHFAGPHESYPIEVPQDVEDAAGLVGHAADPAAVKAKIISIAHQMGPEFVAKLPDSWTGEEGEGRAADLPEETRSMPDQTIEQVLFAPVTRVDEQRREITVTATSEAVDSFRTRFDFDASCDAFDRWIGNVREMHQAKAVGTRVAVHKDPVARKIDVTLRISKGAPDTWEKVLDGTLKGASIGASNVVWERPTTRDDSEAIPTARKFDLVELSLVDNPSNPDSRGITVLRNALPDEALLDTFDEADVTRLTEFNPIPETEATQPAPSTPAALAMSMGLGERGVVNGEQMPAAPLATATPSLGAMASATPAAPSFPRVAGAAVQQRMEEANARMERDERIRAAGDAAVADAPPWQRGTDYSRWAAEIAQIRGAAEAQEVRRLQGLIPPEPVAPAAPVEEPVEEPVAQQAAPAPVAAETTPERVEQPAVTRSVPAAPTTPIEGEHTHANGTTHSHAYLDVDHRHVHRGGAPLDAALLVADTTRATWKMDGKQPEAAVVPLSGSAQMKYRQPATSALMTNAPSQVAPGREIPNTWDAQAVDFGTPEQAQTTPSPTGEEDLTLDASSFHEGGHQPMGSLNGGNLDRDRVDDEGGPAQPTISSRPPAPTDPNQQKRPTPASARAAAPDTEQDDPSEDEERAVSKLVSGPVESDFLKADSRERTAPASKNKSKNSAIVQAPDAGGQMTGPIDDADMEGPADYDADEDDVMISSRQPQGSAHDMGDRRPTKAVGKDPMDNSVNIGESGSPTAPITAKTPFVKPHAIPGQPRAQESSEQRVGARLSADSVRAVHDLRDGAMEQARSACQHCGCGQCQAELAALDTMAEHVNEPQEIARSMELFGQSRILTALFERAVEERLASLIAAVESRFNDLDLTLADSLAEQQRRDARSLDPSSLAAEYTRALPGHVSAAVAQAAEPITQRLETLVASVAGVKGDVERIANQPAVSAQSAWSGIADNVAHKVLPTSPPYAQRSAESDLSVAERISVLQDMAQRSTNSSVQSELAAEILQLQRSEGGGLPPIRRLAGGR
jgi:hypothetical protein